MKPSRVVLSFDDGRKDNYDIVIPILEKYCLTATFNISTAYVDKSINVSDRPCLNEPMTIENIKAIYGKGFEIACHGDRHKNDIEDIRRGYKKLSTWLQWGKNFKPGFASPNSRLLEEDIRIGIDKYQEMFAYVRIAAYNKTSLLRRIVRKIAHISHSLVLYKISFMNCVGGMHNNFIVASVPIIHVTTVNQIKAIIMAAQVEHKDCVLMFHSILPQMAPYYDDTFTWDVDCFDELCKWLRDGIDSKNLNVVRTMDLCDI